MIPFIIFYCVFSYFFMIGVASIKGNVPFWHVLLSPLIVPIVLGGFVAVVGNK
jgi:hypothetical protein